MSKTFGEVVEELNNMIAESSPSQSRAKKWLEDALNGPDNGGAGLAFSVDVPYSITGTIVVNVSCAESSPLNMENIVLPCSRVLSLEIKKKLRRGKVRNEYVLARLEWVDGLCAVKPSDTLTTAARVLCQGPLGLERQAKALVHALNAHQMIRQNRPISYEGYRLLFIGIEREQKSLIRPRFDREQTNDEIWNSLQDYGLAIQAFRNENGLPPDAELDNALKEAKQCDVFEKDSAAF